MIGAVKSLNTAQRCLGSRSGIKKKKLYDFSSSQYISQARLTGGLKIISCTSGGERSYERLERGRWRRKSSCMTAEED